jgi:NAD(P)-dependent dehydrogenase (short-subunit alcohol dehydrogenase family)
MTTGDKVVLVTGANRGIGQALDEEALARGAKRVYAGTRQPLTHPDERVTPLILDVTNAAQIQAAVEAVESLDIPINNAGVALYDDLSDRGTIEQHLAVHLFGTRAVTQAFLPLLTRSRGAIVNGLSLLAGWRRQGDGAPERCAPGCRPGRVVNPADVVPARFGVMPRSRAAATPAALTVTLGIAATSWVVVLRQMSGMDMGVATQLGSLRRFVVLWVLMMAAMMLPGAAPAVLRRTRAIGRVRAVPAFVGSYLAVWALVGLAVFALYQPHGTVAAGVVSITAGAYELTPLKQRCRQRCRDSVGSGLEFGLYCVGSSTGLMLILVGLGVMSIAWMATVAVLVVAQKLLPRKAALDVPLALAIIGLGALIIIAPSSVPGLMPSM